MGKIINTITFYGLFLWQILQNIIGLFMFLYFKMRRDLSLVKYDKFTYCFKSKYMHGGISLGSFIFLSEYSATNEKTIAHEYGHCVDSKIMGPLYLFIIGIPSILNAIFCFTDCYYDFFTEKRANKNAGLIVTKSCKLQFPKIKQ